MFAFCAVEPLWAQEQTSIQAAPPLNSFRAEENYAYLQSTESSAYAPSFGDGLKYLVLDNEGVFYARVGGQYRVRWEHFTNDNWTDEKDVYYSQRVAFHGSLHAGDQLRLFAEVYHGLTGNQDRLLEDDELDLHQGFLEWKPIDEDERTLSVRLGRQEISFGVSRLIGMRDGPNIRRSFDLGRVTYNKGRMTADLLYGQEVSPQFDAFDNASHLFQEANTQNPRLWLLYLTGPGFFANGMLDAYYVGFQSEFSSFSDVMGKETRHSFGLRSSGSVKEAFSYNTEIIAQFGTLGGNTIQAFNIEADWKYSVLTMPTKPAIGVKFDWSTGDREAGDGKLETFNPLFVNPGIYSLAGVNTPANLTSFHPNITFYPAKGLMVYLEYAVFYRTHENDGFYAPPRFQTRPAEGVRTRHIGDVVGVRVAWQFNRNISFTLLSSYYLAGGFMEETGPSNNIFYVSPTLDFKF